MKRSILLLCVFIFSICFISCNIGVNGISASDIPGCYRTSIPDPHCPEPATELTDFYIQLWDDGSGEGGFWDTPLTESSFFTWELLNDTLVFTSFFSMFDNCSYTLQTDDSTDFQILADRGDSTLAVLSLTDDIVSRVDYTDEQILGSWTSSRGDTCTFASDGSLVKSGYTPTTWSRGDISYTIEIGWGAEWAVRENNGILNIMCGYNNILTKQP